MFAKIRVVILLGLLLSCSCIECPLIGLSIQNLLNQKSLNPVARKLSDDYINGRLNIQARMISNTVNGPSPLKLYRNSRYVNYLMDRRAQQKLLN
ncbi:hypothetical protein ACLKA7_003325 [Drosophila subpalustris]